MAVVRRNVLTDAGARASYIRGVMLLKQENTTFQTTAFGIPGPANPVRTYDLFVIWHAMTMMTPVPPTGDPFVRNAAHRGPVFLPWHRLMLAWMELQLRRVLNNPNFALPYWDWSVDGSFPTPQSSLIWQDRPDAMGGDGDPITTGPFAFNPANPNSFRVLIEADPGGALRQTDRSLRRKFGQPPPLGSPTLPNALDVGGAFNTLPAPLGEPDLAKYDEPPYNKDSKGFRNRLEGFTGPGLHNQVHNWVGSDLGPASSPNDPIFSCTTATWTAFGKGG